MSIHEDKAQRIVGWLVMGVGTGVRYLCGFIDYLNVAGGKVSFGKFTLFYEICSMHSIR